MTALKARKLTAQQASAMWAEFYDAYGPEVMMTAYGWRAPDTRQPRRGERVWEFSADGARVGWGICALNTDDPDDNEAMLVVGVFPEYRRQGHRITILDWMSAWAQSKGADYAKLVVFAENEANHQRHHDEADDERNSWVWAGDVWFPHAYSVFVRQLTSDAQPPAAA